MSSLSPLARVNRLREETAQATPGPWDAYMTETTVNVGADKKKIVGTPSYAPNRDENTIHIARWDPVAAGKVLDLLDLVERELLVELKELAAFVRVETGHAPTYRQLQKVRKQVREALLAVLDQLDGRSNQ